MPSSQFLSLAPAKQDVIISAGLAEFAAHGYDLASTNRIVRRAGISKGALFKYFADKEGFFLYVISRTVGSYLAGMPVEQPDLLSWLRAVTAYKFQYIRQQPDTYALWARLTKHADHPVYAKALRAQVEVLQEFRPRVPVASDRPLRAGVTGEHLLNLVMWIANGLQEQFLATAPDEVGDAFDAAFQTIVNEFDRYLDIVRNGLYQGT
ncbi:MAG: TetR/AcrR family transcriptional regulator [Clostridia bacterium]